MRNWFCPKCGGNAEYCGPRTREYLENGRELFQLTTLLYCKNCNANIEFTKLSE